MSKLILIILVCAVQLFSFSQAEMKTSSTSESKVQKHQKAIDINTASVTEFMALPRIGKKIAERIIHYRKTHGKFKRIEDLMKVKGIGEKTFLKFRKRLRVKNGKSKRSR